MASARLMVGTWFGVFAALAGFEHGYFELLQGNVAPPGLMFPSIGAPCLPESVWHSCEPALTIIPNLAAAGIVTGILSAITLAWALAFIGRTHGGLVLALLSLGLLLAGGGVLPPVIGVVGGLVAMGTGGRAERANSVVRLAAAFWPWSLAALAVFLVGMVTVGYFFNDFMKQNAIVLLVAIPALMVLTGISAWARDRAG
jgi:hypothetical protein